jgi:hypothetical protein
MINYKIKTIFNFFPKNGVHMKLFLLVFLASSIFSMSALASRCWCHIKAVDKNGPVLHDYPAEPMPKRSFNEKEAPEPYCSKICSGKSSADYRNPSFLQSIHNKACANTTIKDGASIYAYSKVGANYPILNPASTRFGIVKRTADVLGCDPGFNLIGVNCVKTVPAKVVTPASCSVSL